MGEAVSVSQTGRRIPERAPFWDNLKGELILLVVFGHLLERTPGGGGSLLYRGIYLFHMPLFVFVSGYLTRCTRHPNYGKILTKLVVPYLVFQTVFCIYYRKPLQFTTPWWILWYVMALAVWRLSVPIFAAVPENRRWWVIAGAFLLGYAVGFDQTVGYYLSLSRVLVFLPFFLLGLYRLPGLAGKQVPRWLLLAAALGVLALLAGLSGIPGSRFYGSRPYGGDASASLARLFQYGGALVVGGAVLAFTPHRRCVLTQIGRHSMAIYLLQPLLCDWMRPRLSGVGSPLLCAAGAVLFCAAVAAAGWAVQWVRSRFPDRA